MIHTLINAVRGFLSGDGALILPEMELVLFGFGILLVDGWFAANEKHWNALLALAGTAFSGFTLYVQHGRMEALRAVNPESPGLLGFRQSVLVDPFFLFFAVLFLVATVLAVLLSVRYLEIAQEGRGAYYALLLFASAGMMLMISSVDLIAVFLGLQIMSVSCFLLTGFARSGHGGTGSSRGYALVWACSSFALAGGFLVLYRLFQTTNLGRMGAILETRLDNGVAFGGLTSWPAPLALVLIVVGNFFLVDSVPLPWLAPAIYDSTATPAAAWLSVAAKTAGFVLLLRFFSFLFIFVHEKWIHVWGAAASIALLWGNLAALRQTNVKRLLAYGSIAQTGFILFGLVAGSEAGFIGTMYYLGVHVFMTAGAFGVLILLQQRGAAGIRLADLDGLYRRSPTAALLLLVFMMSLAGVPPTAGFLAKFYIVKALLAATHPKLAAFAVVNALLSVYYYGRVAAHAWKKPAAEVAPLDAAAPAAMTISSAQTIALTTAAFVSLAAGMYPEPFLRIARYAFGQ
jgi:NADH-quinone oxidoreductase subunit N